jgi:hypothetical protein
MSWAGQTTAAGWAHFDPWLNHPAQPCVEPWEEDQGLVSVCYECGYCVSHPPLRPGEVLGLFSKDPYKRSNMDGTRGPQYEETCGERILVPVIGYLIVAALILMFLLTATR